MAVPEVADDNRYTTVPPRGTSLQQLLLAGMGPLFANDYEIIMYYGCYPGV